MSTNIFVKSTAPTEDQGVMNIGKHCHQCQQLDFLPFVCESCKHTFCSQHRTFEGHGCKATEKQYHPSSYNGESAASLFPDRDQHRAIVNHQIEHRRPTPTTILEKQFRVGDAAAGKPNAFSKFRKFLLLQKKKKLLAGKLGLRSAGDAALLRRQAKGDAKVQPGDRVYVWVLYVNRSDEESSWLVNVEADRTALWVSKNWPVGRALDSIADHLRIMNYNNSTRDSHERLNIFKVNGQEPVLVENSGRVAKAFANGDIIYLVKGSL